MINLTEKFVKLKTSIGGNREKMGFEDTFGMPKEEQAHITRPSRANTRIIGELEFAIKLSEELDGKYDAILNDALDYLLEQQRMDGVLTNSVCEKAEAMLAPMEADAKAYTVILVGHAHIDMNWMWSFNETVAIVLATFRSILNIMDQYPEFHFSQSQAAVYKIVEDYDHDLMEKIKARIAEGRWEVTASSWVENDKNMPGTEAMLRHIQCTRDYLKEVWSVKDFDIDFSPDTFGHSGNMPELDTFGGIRYFYHCRGLADDIVLYRYKGLSGKELLAYKEPYWYNGAITPHIGSGLIEISRKCAGLKTGLIVYGVGDHGGGPTRRDIERGLEMMTWKIYPTVKFGTMREFFHAAESVRDKLQVIHHEVNYFAPGCYTTQSRLKRGNKRTEATLNDAEAMSALAGKYANFPYAKAKMDKAWQDVLFTHFHDILTGSCVQDSREHAMGLFQTSIATANTQIQNAMRVIAENIDTSSILVDIDAYNTQSEGAGAGYGIENFVGVPSTERGSGRTRIFHIFNSLAFARKEVVELTVWDWTGDMREICVKDYKGNPLAFQMVDTALQQYWDHKYFRILVDAAVPAFGYTTVVLSQKTPTIYRTYRQLNERVSKFYDDMVLQNDKISVVISAKSGHVTSISKVDGGVNLIRDNASAGLVLLETETKTSNAWQIGRTIKEIPVDECLELKLVCDDELRQSVTARYKIEDSTAEVTYTLDKHSAALQTSMKIDWHGIGREIIPVLAYKVPVSYAAQEYVYDIPGGTISRTELHNDVPAIRYGLVKNPSGESILLSSDCKYGYRGEDDSLTVTLINSATSPDPYPERGIQTVNIWTAVTMADAKENANQADCWSHKLFYQPSNSHHGTLPMETSLLSFESDNAVLCAATPAASGATSLLVSEANGISGTLKLNFNSKITQATVTNWIDDPMSIPITVNGTTVVCTIEPYQMLKINIAF